MITENSLPKDLVNAMEPLDIFADPGSKRVDW